jgi:hypothetical protein
MTFEKKATCVSIVLGIVVCFISLYGAQGQQPATSFHFGASASRSGSTASARASVRGTGSGGSSTWGAGKGSFGYSAQPGGVWRDGSTLGAAPGAARATTQEHASAANAISPGGNVAAGSFSPAPPNVRGNAVPRTAHLSRPSLGQRSGIMATGRGSVSGSSGMRHAAVGSRGRSVMLARGAGKNKNRPYSGVAPRVTQRAPTLGLPGISAPRTELDKLDTGLITSGVESQP